MTDLWLAGPVTSVAYGWRLERGDGVTLGFTSHDRDVLHDGLLLRASPGMRPSTIIESIGLETDGLEVSGSLTADAIGEKDLIAGKFNSAFLEIFLFDWASPENGKRLLASGTLGTVSLSDGGFECEFSGLNGLLDLPVSPATSPYCRARFCDAECGLSRERFRHVGRAQSITGSRVDLSGISDRMANDFAFGSLRVLSGDGCGRTFEIASSDGSGVDLIDKPGDAIANNTLLELIEGCDKQLGTCASRFANAINFRGEPYLPGNDLLTRYPGAS